MVGHIYEYKSGKEQQHCHNHQLQLERFYYDYYSKNNPRLLIQQILHGGKKKWFYGAVAIVAHAVAARQKPTSWFFFYYFHGRWLTWIQVTLVELMLWSMGFSLAWHSWLSQRYKLRVKTMAIQKMDELDRVVLEPKNNVWIMMMKKKEGTNDHGNSNIIGVAMIRPFPATNSQLEGHIQVTALTSQTQLALVQTAIQFARQQDIKVIYTQDDIRKNKVDGLF
ncbi:unnamed protein product [Absidia cylindrospora]